MQNLQPIIALENVRSLYNVGSILRTCSFFGVKQVVLIGYSGKIQLPNGSFEISPRIKKTSLGSETDVELICMDKSTDLLNYCANKKIPLFALEQFTGSKNLFTYKFEDIPNAVFVVGNEVDGVSSTLLNASNDILEIPRQGVHNSLNVSISVSVLLTALSCR